MNNGIPTIIIASVFVVIGGLLFLGYEEGESIGIPPRTDISPLSIHLDLEPSYTINDKFGKNTDVGDSWEDIWNTGGTITLLTSPSTFTVTSTGVDTSGGTGARAIVLEGLDSTWAAQSVTVTLDSTTPPVTAETWLRLNRAYVTDVGSGGVNANDIIITATTGGSTQGGILAGEGQTQKAIYTIPLGYTGFLETGMVSSHSGQEITAQLLTRLPDESWRVKYELIMDSGHFDFPLVGSPPLPEKTDIKWRVQSPHHNNDVNAGWKMVLREN
jgi:hypothetical protein